MILFIPGDQFLSAALAEKPDLLDEALRQNIILATPTSLVALLKAIAYGWQQTALAENAAEIRGLAVQLYERLTTFASHVDDTGKSLGDSVKAFNRSVGSLERMVLPSARRFTDLGVQPRQRLATLKDVEETPRDYSVDDRMPGRGGRDAAARPGGAPNAGRSTAGPHRRSKASRRYRAAALTNPVSTAARLRMARLRPAADALAGRVILVTGATAGIGRAVARALVQHGATRAAARPQRAEAAEALYQEIKTIGPEPAVAQLDLERAQGPQYQALTRRDRDALRAARRPAAQRWSCSATRARSSTTTSGSGSACCS